MKVRSFGFDFARSINAMLRNNDVVSFIDLATFGINLDDSLLLQYSKIFVFLMKRIKSTLYVDVEAQPKHTIKNEVTSEFECKNH